MDLDNFLTEIQNKNHFVFKRLFDDMYHDLVTYANGYLFDMASSEDVVQEIFVRLWEKSNKIVLKTNLKAYLYAMVRNKCLNRLKKLKITDNSNILDRQISFAFDQEPDWFTEQEKEIRNQQALCIIENLPLRMRSIVELRFRDNYRYKEIAEELNVSINTVKTQLKRAKAKLGELTASITVLLLFL
ncbi:RNA polymerase sigma factor [Zobellia roscoffensis]|uniref:RNA polymerase sigma factor n=1 Tax=Zobellia roscoffensis TaxID=2779508 RepID=UPI00188C2BC6|nr:RNA polymerase sigma-70 factor [Zobellia roscoffensis]